MARVQHFDAAVSAISQLATACHMLLLGCMICHVCIKYKTSVKPEMPRTGLAFCSYHECSSLKPGTGFSWALWVRNPERVRKCPKRGPRRIRPQGAPESQTSAPQSPNGLFGCALGLSFRTLGRTLSGLFGSGTPCRTPCGLFRGSGPKGPGRPLCQACWIDVQHSARLCIWRRQIRNPLSPGAG